MIFNDLCKFFDNKITISAHYFPYSQRLIIRDSKMRDIRILFRGFEGFCFHQSYEVKNQVKNPHAILLTIYLIINIFYAIE